MNYAEFSDEELLGLLYFREDKLTRREADEFIKRGERLVPFLSDIVSDQFKWTREPPEWWAVVHASLILGAIGSESAVIPLLRAMRWADAFECDWVSEALPAIFGHIGPMAVAALKAVAADETSGCYTRSVALESLGFMARKHPEIKPDVSRFIYSIFSDKKSDLDARKFAGNTLLDLRCEEYREQLLAFGKEERVRKDQDRFYPAHFFDDDVEEALNTPGNDMQFYDRDWLSFYDEKAIAARQKRWEKEKIERDHPVDEDIEEVRQEEEPYIRTSYIGRNDPCPCGSGKKYKKCCLGKDI